MFIFQAIMLAAMLACTVNAGPIENLQAGQWYDVPNSNMDAVKHSVNGPNMWDVSCVIGCWCGGALDTKRNHLIVWGGGHGQYSGNEIYYFDLDSLKWFRENDPSNPPGVDVPYAPDGNPTSRHSANALQYIQSIDRFVAFGGMGFYIGGQTGTSNVDYYDFNARKWETHVSTIPSNASGAPYGFSAYDAGSGIAYSHGSWSTSQFARYNLAAKTWTTLTLPNNHFMDNGWGVTAAIDPKTHQMVIIGSSAFLYSLGNSGSTSVSVSTLTTTGDNSIQGAHTPGLDYDPVTEKMIAWSGGQGIYSLNLATKVWTMTTGGGANPGSPDGNGTYGRFRYCPKKNVFAVVNSSSGHVFIYRHTAAASAPQWYLDALQNGSAVEAGALHGSTSNLSIATSPNPFRGRTEITVSGAALGFNPTVSVYDLLGKKVASVSPRTNASGAASYVLESRGMAPGLHFIKVEAGGSVACKSILMIE